MGKTKANGDICHTRLLTLDEAIDHAEQRADDTIYGRNHRQLAEWLKELDLLRTTPTGDVARLRMALVKAHTMLKVCEWPDGIDLVGVAGLMKEIEAAIDEPANGNNQKEDGNAN